MKKLLQQLINQIKALKVKSNDTFKMKGVYEFVIRDAKTGRVKRREVIENLIPTVGLNAIAQQFVGDNTEEQKITYLSLGNNGDTPALGDTALGNETLRTAITVKSASTNIAQFSVFFNSGEANDTHKEIGMYGDGAASVAGVAADSGILYSRTLISPSITKTTSETLTINYTLTISQ